MTITSAFVLTVLDIIAMIAGFLIWVLVIEAILSWLLLFGILNPYSGFIALTRSFFSRLTTPLLRPLRRFIKPMGGIDWAPLALIVILVFIQTFIHRLSLPTAAL